MQKSGPVLDRIPDAAIKPFLATFHRRGHDDPEQAKPSTSTGRPPPATARLLPSGS